MSRTGWKQVERDVAEVLGCKRFWANAGERVDADSPIFSCQVKNVKTLSLARLEALVEEMLVDGHKTNRLPVVAVKRSAGSARQTPALFVVPGSAFLLLRELYAAWPRLHVVLTAHHSVREYLALPKGCEARVAAFVEKSKQRARRPRKKTQS